MKPLGLGVEPVSFGYPVFNEKFLLSREESSDLVSRLKKIPMNTRFRPDEGAFPEDLIPGKLPGGVLNDFTFQDLDSLYHLDSDMLGWNVSYGSKPINNVKFYPTLHFNLRQLDDCAVLKVTPTLGLWWEISEEPGLITCALFDRCQSVFYDLALKYLDNKSKELVVSLSSSGLYNGLIFAPATGANKICSSLEFLISCLTAEELAQLNALREFGRNDNRIQTYSEDEQRAKNIAFSAVRKEYSALQENIIEKLRKKEFEHLYNRACV